MLNSWESAIWEEMEEAYVITGGGRSNQSSLQAMADPVAVSNWLEGISIGTTIKIIISNREAVYLKLQDIKNSSQLHKILIEKIRFVKN